MNEEQPLPDIHREHIELHAEQYQRAQACKVLRLFREANGHDARDMEELNQWTKHADHERPLKPDPEDYEAAKREA